MAEVKVTGRMRNAAPELCKQIDALRTQRHNQLDRHNYAKRGGKDDEAAAVLRAIQAIDAKIAPLHAAAKQKMLEGLFGDRCDRAPACLQGHRKSRRLLD